MLGVQLQAQATRGEALVVMLLQQVAHLQPGLVLCGVGQHAALGWGVVHHQLVETAAAALAGVQRLGFDASQGGVVGVTLMCTRSHHPGTRPGRWHRDLIALCIGCALAVVGGADHDRAVDVAFHKGHDHFLPPPEG